jgi:hypothetical protein
VSAAVAAAVLLHTDTNTRRIRWSSNSNAFRSFSTVLACRVMPESLSQLGVVCVLGGWYSVVCLLFGVYPAAAGIGIQ